MQPHASSYGAWIVKKIFLAGLLVLSVATASAQTGSPPPRGAAATAPASRAHVLTRSELDSLLAHPQDLLVIDVRRPDEVSKVGGLPVYLSIQLNDLEKSLVWIPRGRTIITVSNHAKRAGTAADLLTSKGFKVAGAAGVQTYEEEGGKLTKIVPPPSSSASPNAGAGASPAATARSSAQ
jgi:rhodanese-related sulfurtransferase